MRKIKLPVDEVIKLYKDGNTITSIRKLYGCSGTPVKRILKDAGIKIRIGLELPIDEIIELYKNNISIATISRKYNCGSTTIHRILKNNNIKVRSNSESLKIYFDDPKNREKSRDVANKRWENPLEHEKQSTSQKKRFSDPDERRRLKEGNINYFSNPINRIKHGISQRERYSDIRERIKASCKQMGIKVDDWVGFAYQLDPDRSYLEPAHNCVKLNSRFVGSHGHHILSNVMIYIPGELHNHISHNLRTGEGMDVINILAFQYLNNYYYKSTLDFIKFKSDQQTYKMLSISNNFY